MIEKRILRKNEVLERLGIRKTSLYDSFIKTGRLRFVKIGARAVGIIEDIGSVGGFNSSVIDARPRSARAVMQKSLTPQEVRWSGRLFR
jgi:hypothetical protein